jgi:hypothetical protein
MRDAFAVFENFILHAADDRAQRYRDQAVKLRELAAVEQIPTFRSSLFEVAAKYDELADEIRNTEAQGTRGQN